MDILWGPELLQGIEAILMSPKLLVIGIVIASIALFISEKMPIDGVAFLVLVALLVFGLVPENEILQGFSSQATMTVAAMFILSAGLQRTGFVRFLANKLHTMAGKGRSRLNLVLMSCCGFLSAFINNTATVAVLLPVTLSMCRDRKINPSQVLMPLSFAAQFGGVCTLIGTTTNLLVNMVLVEEGLEPFSMFEFARLGGICFVAGTVYMLVIGPIFLGRRQTTGGAASDYQLQDYLTEMRVCKKSPLIGQTGDENELNELGNFRILEIIRGGKMIWAPQSTEIKEEDILLIRGPVDRIMEASGRLKLEDWAEGNLSDAHLESDDIGLVEVILPSASHLVGRTLNQLDFYWRYHAAVLGVRRRGEVLRERIASVQFQESDTLLLQGHKDDLAHLSSEKDFLLLKDLSELKLKKKKALTAFLILSCVVVATALGICSLLTAALIGVAAIVLTRCLSLREAYQSVDMKVILLLAGLIPLGFAMKTTGTASWMVETIFQLTGNSAPFVIMCVLYVLTMILTAVMSNNATAVLLAPLAISMADSFGIDPRPFLITVTFAASTCFTTPIGYQTNAMIYGPGNYRYLDFLIVGLPLNIIFFVISVTLIPMFWPF